jgi:hypothetical protein
MLLYGKPLVLYGRLAWAHDRQQPAPAVVSAESRGIGAPNTVKLVVGSVWKDALSFVE